MKKIKSVKLKNDYRSWNLYLPKGTVLNYNKGDKEWILEDDLTFGEGEIKEDVTNLFEIEYEEERKYIDVRIDFSEDCVFIPDVVGSLKRKLINQFSASDVNIILLGEGTL